MPHQSLYPSIPIPEVDIFTHLFGRDDQQPLAKPFPPTKEILTDGERPHRSYTWAQLRSRSAAFARGLRAEWGWRRGDVLAFYTPNDVDTAVLTCGVLRAGGAASPANPLYTEAELAHQLADARAAALVTQLEFLPRARDAARRAGLPEDRILLLGERPDPEGKVRHWTSLVRPEGEEEGGGGGLLARLRGVAGAGGSGSDVVEEVRPREDLAFLVYSSGTTGLPKGVRLTHYNVVSNLLQNDQMDGHHLRPSGGPGGRGDRMLGVLPFFHIYVRYLTLHRTECFLRDRLTQ